MNPTKNPCGKYIRIPVLSLKIMGLQEVTQNAQGHTSSSLVKSGLSEAKALF